MKVALVGGGGREHALAKKLLQSPLCTKLVVLPGNGGIAGQAECVPIKPTDLQAVVEYCALNRVDYAVVAPDDPLALGLVDALAQKGIPAFGPTRAAAAIEASKVFAKNLMHSCGIPTAAYAAFGNTEEALAHLWQNTRWPVVVKADGLALGKGVMICENYETAGAAVQSMMQDKIFGQSGSRVVIEEFLTGPEVSVLSFCDGKTLVPMVSSMDHKRALNGDKGPNTGGMGAVAPNPFYTQEIAQRCMQEIFLPTVRAMAAQGAPFKGCLYFGLMLTKDGPKVIEYNCRFGDPETQVVLPLLQSDLLEIMLACTEGRLCAPMVRFADGAAACVVLASGGYPGAYQTGFTLHGLAQAAAVPGVQLYHAGTRAENGAIYTAGGRVLGVSATAQTLPAALQAAYDAAACVTFEGVHYRKDIGKTALAALQGTAI